MSRVVVTAAAVACAFVAGAARADYIDHFATRTDVGVYKVPAVGETRVLVIPVLIDDQPYSAGSEAAFLEEIADFYVDDDVSVFDGGFRFTAWWRQQSLGKFVPRVDVAAPVHFATCPPLGPHADCAIPRGAGFAEGDLQGAIATVADALAFLDEVLLCAQSGPGGARSCSGGGGVDLAAYDTRGNQAGPDGFVDGVIVISNANFPGIALPVKDIAAQPLLQFAGPFPSFEYGAVTVGAVAIAGAAAPPQRETFVSVHEFGHLLGFADLYNEAGTTTDLPYTLMGGWFYDSAASLLDPFSRVAIGWANVVQVAGPGSFTLPSAARSGVVLKVGDGDEFFLVEHRQRVVDAFDGDFQIDGGVLVERVRLQKRPSPAAGNYFNTLQNCVNCTPFDPMLMIEEADGEYQLQRNRGRDDAGAFFQAGDAIAPSTNTDVRSAENPVFSTNLLDGTPTGITITVRESDGAGAVVDVDAPAIADPCAAVDDLCVADCAVADGAGRCGDFVEFPAAVPGDGGEPPAAGGCACASTSTSPAAGAPGALFLLASLSRFWRRRCSSR